MLRTHGGGYVIYFKGSLVRSQSGQNKLNPVETLLECRVEEDRRLLRLGLNKRLVTRGKRSVSARFSMFLILN
jgi:hypothetical protein